MTEPQVCAECGRVIGPLDWPRQPAVTPTGEGLDVNTAYREGRRAVWAEVIELANEGIEASSEPKT